MSTCFVEKLEHGAPGEATAEPCPPAGWRKPPGSGGGGGGGAGTAQQPQRRAKGGGLVPGSGGLRGPPVPARLPAGPGGTGPSEGRPGGPLAEGECVGSQHPSSKERQEAAPGARKRKRLGSGSCGHGVRPGGAAGGEKKAWLRAELAPRPPPTPGPPCCLPPRPAPCVPGGETARVAGARARGDGAAVSGDLQGPAATSGESPNLSWFLLLHPENGNRERCCPGREERRGQGGEAGGPSQHPCLRMSG